MYLRYTLRFADREISSPRDPSVGRSNAAAACTKLKHYLISEAVRDVMKAFFLPCLRLFIHTHEGRKVQNVGRCGLVWFGCETFESKMKMKMK